MVTRDLKRLLQKLNDHLTRSLEAAAGFSISRGNYEVTFEHLWIKLLEDGNGDIPRILARFEVDTSELWERLLGRLEELRTGNTGRPAFSPMLLQLLESAWIVSSVHHDLDHVRSGALLEAFLESEAHAMESYRDLLAGISKDELRKEFFDLVGGSVEDQRVRSGSAHRLAEAEKRKGDTAIDLYTVDVTGKARAGDIDPVYGRDMEIRQAIDILSRRRKNNPILVGEAGVGKTAIVEGLALRIAEGDVPDSLKEIEIRTLDLGLLQAGAGVKGEFENRLKSVIDEVREAPKPTIMFIDEAHTLIGAGGAAGTSDAANLLKPALARGELRTIAATTWSEYKKYIEKDPALERRFQLIKIDEPSADLATVMLRGIKEKYETHHRVHVTDEAVTAAASLSARFISGRQLPDKAVDLLDTASARVKMTQTTRPGTLDDIDRRLHHLELEITAIERDEGAGITRPADVLAQLREEAADLEKQRTELEARWESELELVTQITDVRQKLGNGQADSKADAGGSGDGAAGSDATDSTDAASGTDGAVAAPETAVSDGKLLSRLQSLQRKLSEINGESPMVHAEVNPQVIAQVIADWTGIPVGNMLKDEAATLLEIDNRLAERILGQDEGITEVAETIRSAKAGMGNPDAPIAVFLFVGPSGVGKTECALALADLMFGGERFLSTINMSEYQEKHTVSQLKGSPPGYVGYGEGGVLTEAVRRRPYSVVLLDEVEKAHRDVMNLFYQVFDKGTMRDGEGREIDFRNTVMIMTSNLASDILTYAVTEDERPDADQLREAIHQTLAEHFQPALLARMKVVPFYPLGRSTMEGIVAIKLGRIGDRLGNAHNIAFEYEPEVVQVIADRCTQVDAGARNVDFVIDRHVLPAASRALIARMMDDESPTGLTLRLGEQGEFVYDFA